jgi:Rrf2 family protein
VISAREIASRNRVPLPLLMNVLKLLASDEIVTSVRGAKGGYRLALPPRQISLARIIESVEGPVRLVQCAGPRSGRGRHNCERQELCLVRRAAHKLHARLYDVLDDVTLADVAAEAAPAAAAR